MSKYKANPTTDEVREAYQADTGLQPDWMVHARGEAFDRWLEGVKHDAWKAGAEAAIEREHTYGREEKAKYDNPYKATP